MPTRRARRLAPASLRRTTVGTVLPEVLEFTAGADRVLDLALVEADCIGTAAHVTMLSRLRGMRPVLTPRECRRVIRELVGVMERSRDGRFPITVDDQDVHLAVERHLTVRLGNLGKKVHTARSRNDQVATDLRLFAKEQLLGCLSEGAALAGVLVAWGRRHARVPMVGRTHMQPAMPSSVGLWATAAAENLFEDLEWLSSAYRINDRSPLGFAASYGVPLPIDRALTARLLGFRAPVHNVLAASNARGTLEFMILSGLAAVMLTLSRYAGDLALFTMPEFGYFELPPGFGTGSSIMPQKRNPDELELIRARAARVVAAAGTAAEIARGLPGGYNRDLQEIKPLLMEGFATARSSLRILAPLAAGLQARREALRRGFTPDVFATDRALALVADGVPFRDAYHHVKEHLDELRREDPGAAVRRKRHLGAPAGVDYAALAARARGWGRFAQAEWRRHCRCASRLLGASYPLRGSDRWVA
jgi:argininosuccinate lyase